MRHFLVTAGSVVGREHVRLLRNNQDGVGLTVEPDLIVAVVTDGCSSCRASEVGARLAAEWLAVSARSYLEAAPDLPAEILARAIVRGLLAFLEHTAQAISPQGRVSAEVVNDYFLFTLIVAIVSPERTIVFGVGDGVVFVNGVLSILDSGEENAPRYAAYALLDAGARPSPPVVHWEGATAVLQTLLIATDGAAELEARRHEPLAGGEPQGGLAELASDPRYARNPSLLHKRLAVIGALNARLHDDTTIALVRREARAPREPSLDLSPGGAAGWPEGPGPRSDVFEAEGGAV